MSIAPDDTTDTDPDFVTTPEGQPVDPKKIGPDADAPAEDNKK